MTFVCSHFFLNLIAEGFIPVFLSFCGFLMILPTMLELLQCWRNMGHLKLQMLEIVDSGSFEKVLNLETKMLFQEFVLIAIWKYIRELNHC